MASRALSAKELKAYEEKLRMKLAELEVTAKATGFPPAAVYSNEDRDSIDLAQAAFSRELFYALREKDAALYRSIRAALERIENQTYGYCASCGCHINRKRLDALPWAELCLDCQEANESQHDELKSDSAGCESEVFEEDLHVSR